MEALGEVRVKGHVKVLIECECDRCLEMTALPIDSDFELFYQPVEEGHGGEERVLDDDAAQMGFYEGEGLELNDVLREFILFDAADAAFVQGRLCGDMPGVRAKPQQAGLPVPDQSGG